MASWRRLLPPALLAGAATAVVAGVAWLWPSRAPATSALPPARHETTDVGLRSMLLAGTGMLATLAALLGLVLWLFPLSIREEPVGPLPPFPEPQLQSDPARDMAAFHAQQLRQLDAAYWIDRAAGRVHVPIARAMQDVAGQGIADWPTK